MLPQLINYETKQNYCFPGKERATEKDTYMDDIEAYVTRFVRKLGIRPNLKGYHLLIETIILAIEKPILLSSLTKGLYPVIAQRYGKDVRFVERNIRRAVDSAYEYDPEKIKSAFYYSVGKPYISEVISMCVEELRFRGGISD